MSGGAVARGVTRDVATFQFVKAYSVQLTFFQIQVIYEVLKCF